MFKSFQILSYSTLFTALVACNSNPSSSTEVTSPETEVEMAEVDSLIVDSSEVDNSVTDSSSFSEAEIETQLTGSFKQTDVQLSGDYTIEVVNNELTITLSEDFQHDSGPDLFIALVKPQAKSLGIYDFNQIPETDKIILGDILTQSAGASRVIPLSQEQLADFNTVLIQCVKWNHTYGIAPITQAN